jgi:FkbH-like protein
MHFFARQPISASYIPDFSGFIARSLNPLLTPSKKLLVLDLDNTLWGGILGEDGVSNLHYGQEYPGNIFRSIQLAVLALKDQGVLLALVSKNNESEVKEAFDILSDMPLRLSDFSATRINWKPKSSNIRSISAELNLGLDSFVFVDDSAFEREEVKSSIPEIVVLNDNESALHILEAITESQLFDGYQSTHADNIRIQDYERNKLRQELRDDSVDLKDYLHSLELTVTNQFIESAQRGRALQMLAKTNQFNVTTRRYNASELDDIISAEGSIVIMTSLRDKFGDQGLIGLAIVISESNEVASIDSFLLSCRALGRGVEHALWASVVSRVVKAGFSTLKASYIPTSRNMQVAELFDKFEMIEVAKIDESTDKSAKNYVLRLPYFPKVPDWLEINEK